MPSSTPHTNIKGVLFSLVGLLFFATSAFAQSNKINPKLYRIITQSTTQKAATIKSIEKNSTPMFGVSVTQSVGAAITKVTPELLYQCIVYTKDARQLKNSGLNIQSVYPSFATAALSSEDILQLANRADISYIDAPRKSYVTNNIAVAETGASLLHAGALNNTKYKGKNVIVAIFDTGIDWKHPDFADPNDATKSRILCIWDQTITPIAGEINAPHFNYGVYYTQAQIDAELASSAGLIREKDTHGHGTHVAGTAAGNGSALPSRKYAGMAPEADIVVVKGGNGSFSDVNEINALTFLKNLADSLNRPIVVNMSLGGQFAAHDGTGAAEDAITSFSNSAPGRVVVVAAGNENGSNIHNQMTIPANGQVSFTFTVPSGMINNTTGDYVLNYLMYLDDNSSISACVTDPLGINSDTVTTGSYINSLMDTAASIRVQLQSDIDGSNNDTYLNLFMDRDSVTAKNPKGVWTLTIKNNTASTITLDGWLAGTGNSGAFANTILSNGDNNYLIGSPGDAGDAITVASYNSNASWYADASPYSYGFYLDSLSPFSSHGPRRDGALKPDITAPGSTIVSCYSSETTPAAPATLLPVPTYYRVMQGTSMATPATTGAVALMLQANPNLTATQVKTLIMNNALNDAVTEAGQATPNAKWGAGKLDVYKAASDIFNPTAGDRKIFKNDKSSKNADIGNYGLSGWVAVRLTPDINGYLGGVYYEVGTITDKTVVEFRADNSGKPGTILGRKKVDSADIALYSMNFLNFSDLKIPITANTDYFVVLYRDSSITSGTWTLRMDNNTNGANTLSSMNGGANWGNYTNDAVVRASVYGVGNATTAIATSTSDTTQDINTNNQFKNGNSELIAQVVPSGAAPVTGSIASKVWLEASVPSSGGNYFVSRHYQITPATNTASATATITLYFKQSEFDAFNAANASGLLLPTDPSDATGIHNLLIGKYAGTSGDNTGLPSSYTGAKTIIDPSDNNIVWNATDNRWEISFDVAGFSGFVVQTVNTTLPVKLVYFTGNKDGKNNILKWKAATATGQLSFELQRSSDESFSSYSTIYTYSPAHTAALDNYTFVDTAALQGNNFYRLKMIERPGGVLYSAIISLAQPVKTLLYPNVIANGQKVNVTFSGRDGYIVVVDAKGALVSKQKLVNGTQVLTLPSHLPSGVYLYKIIDASDRTQAISGKIIIK